MKITVLLILFGVLLSSVVFSFNPGVKGDLASSSESAVGVVTCSSLNVRLEPWGKIIGNLSKGDTVMVEGVSGEWYRIGHNGHCSYASKKYISLVNQSEMESEKTALETRTAPLSSMPGYTTAEYLNFRESPWGVIIGSLKKYSVIQVIGQSGEWFKVIHGGRTGFLHSRYVILGYLPNPLPGVQTVPASGNGSTAGNPSNATSTTTSSGNPGISAERPSGAMTGSKFMEWTAGLSRTAREELILKEILSGNVPDFVKQLNEVKVQRKCSDGKIHEIIFKTMPDYISIGTNEDYIRIPMNPMTAQKIADQWGMSMPTPQIVDDIYSASDTKLTPQPIPPGPQMMSNAYFTKHQGMVEKQLESAGKNGIIAGHKKDVVLTNRLAEKPGRVAIYGWHQKNGKPIQGRSTVHIDTYADYSHGVRLVSNEVMVDGVKMSLQDVFADSVLSKLVSDEGPLRITRQPGA